MKSPSTVENFVVFYIWQIMVLLHQDKFHPFTFHHGLIFACSNLHLSWQGNLFTFQKIMIHPFLPLFSILTTYQGTMDRPSGVSHDLTMVQNHHAHRIHMPILQIHMPIVQIMKTFTLSSMPGTGHCTCCPFRILAFCTGILEMPSRYVGRHNGLYQCWPVLRF
jgi:hypothetical protein